MNVGDRVRIVNEGKIYSTYNNMFEAIGFKNKNCNKFVKKDNIGYIFDIRQHLSDRHKTLLSVQCSNNQYLINIDGVELIKEIIHECW